MAAGLTWWQAEKLARAGIPVRRASWLSDMFNLAESRGPLMLRWVSYHDSLFFTTWEWIGKAPNLDSILGHYLLTTLPARHVVREQDWSSYWSFGSGSEMTMVDFEADDWTDAYPAGEAAGVDVGTKTIPTDHRGTGVTVIVHNGGRPPINDVQPPVAGGGSLGGGKPRSGDAPDDPGTDEPDDGDDPAPPAPAGPQPKPQLPPKPLINPGGGGFSGSPSTPSGRSPRRSKDGDAEFGDFAMTRSFSAQIEPAADGRGIDLVGYMSVSINIAFRNDSDSAFSITASATNGARGSSLGVALAHSGVRTYATVLTFQIGRLPLYTVQFSARFPNGAQTSVFAPKGDDGQVVVGAGPVPPRAEVDAIDHFVENLKSSDAAKRSVTIKATGMGNSQSKYSGKSLPYFFKT